MSGYDTTTNPRDLATHYSPFWWSHPSGLSTEDTAARWQDAVRQARLNPDDTSGTPATAPATDIPTMIVRPASAIDPTAQAQSNPDHRKASDATSQLPPDHGDDGGDSPGWVASAFRSTFGHVDPNQWAAQGAVAGGASGALVGGIAGGAGGGLGGAGAGTLVAPGVGTVGGGVAGGIAGATEGAAAGGVAGAVAGGLIGKAAGTFIVYMEGNGGTPQDDKSAQSEQTEGPATGKLTGSLDGLTPAEKEFAQEQLAAGHDVEVVPTGTQRTPDFKIDGKPVELKTLSGVQNQTSDGLSSAISNRIMSGRGQSGNVIVDARGQDGMTKAIAERATRRAFAADTSTAAKDNSPPKLQELQILTPEGAVTRRRE